MDFAVQVEAVCAAANRLPAGLAASRGIHAWACPEAPCGLVAFGTGSYVSVAAPHALRVTGTLAGHTGRVLHVAWLSALDASGHFGDETELISCSADTTVRVWRLEHALSSAASAGLATAVLGGHSGPVTGVAALNLPGGAALVASISTDCSLRVWHRAASAAGAPPSQWDEPGVHRVRSVGLFEAVTLTVAPAWPALAAAGGPAADLADYGALVVAGGVDCRVHLLGLRGPSLGGRACEVVPLLSVGGHADWVRHLATPPPGVEGWEGPGHTFIASASKDGKVRLWRLSRRCSSDDGTAAAVAEPAGAAEEVGGGDDDDDASAATPGERPAPAPLASIALGSSSGGGADEEALLHSVALAGLERPRVLRLPSPAAAAAGAADAAAGARAGAPRGGGTYELVADALLAGHDGWVTSVAWAPPVVTAAGAAGGALWQPPCLVSSSMDKTVIAWAPANVTAPTPGADPGAAAASAAVGGGGDGRWRGVWEPASRTGGAGGASLGLLGAALCADGATLVAHSLHGALHAWSSRHLASSLADGALPRWPPALQALGDPASVTRLASWGALPTPSGHAGAVCDAVWGSGGAYLLSVSADATTRVWAPVRLGGVAGQQWHEVGRPQIHGYEMTAVAIAPLPGVPHRVISAGDEKVARVFDAPRQFLDTLGAVSCAAAGVLAAPDAVHRAAYAYVPELGLTNKGVETLAAVAAVSDRMQVDGKDAMQLGYDARGLSAKREIAGEAEEGAGTADRLEAPGHEEEGERRQPKQRKGRRAGDAPEALRRGEATAAGGEGADGGGDTDRVVQLGTPAGGSGAPAAAVVPVSSAAAAAAVVWRPAACEPTSMPAPSLPPLEEDIVLHSRWPETGRLFGHSHEIVCVAVSACGRVVATAARARDTAAAALRLWDALACTHLQTLTGAHHLTVAALEFSPAHSSSSQPGIVGVGAEPVATPAESDFLVAAGKDRAVSLYARVRTVESGCAHPLPPSSLGGFDASALPALISQRVTPTYALVAVVAEAHKRIVWGVSWAPHPPDGVRGIFASGSRDQTVKLWTVGTGGQAAGSAVPDAPASSLTCVSTLPVFPAAVTAVAFAPMALTGGEGLTPVSAEAAAMKAPGVFRCALAVGLESGAIGLWVVTRTQREGDCAPTPAPALLWAWDGGHCAALELPLGAAHTDAVRRLAWRPVEAEAAGACACEAANPVTTKAAPSHRTLHLTLASCSSDETLRVLAVSVRLPRECS